MSSRARAALLGLTVALLVALTAAVEANHLAPLAFDRAVHGWVVEHRSPTLTRVALEITETGVGAIAYALAAVAGLLIGRARSWSPPWAGALIAVVALGGVQLLRQGLVQGIARPRPPVSDWATGASGLSFPSGHTTTSATVAALLCFALLQHGRRLAAALAVVWALAVGLTRVYLGVHWPTDVLAGWLLVGVLVAGIAFSFRSGPAVQADDP